MKIFKSRLKLVKGTRFTSFLFIALSLLIAAGILWGANTYYNIDTGEIVVENIQRVANVIRATTGIIVGGTASQSPDSGVTFQVDSGNIKFSTPGTITQTGSGQVTFSGNVDALAGLDVSGANLTVGETNFVVATSTGAITWSGDTNLYRSGANILRTDSNFVIGGSATTTGNLSVSGNVTIDGDLQFLGNQTISGTGTLTINPTGSLYFQSASNYIDELGNLVLAGYVNSSRFQYSGNITIAANAAGLTTVTVINETGTVADLVVEGDINVQGGKITLATGETIDAEAANQVTINSDGLTIIKSGGTERLRVDSNGVKITGSATTTNTLYVTSGGAQITGNVVISSGNMTIQGNIYPSADATYNLGSPTSRWANIYSSQATIGGTNGTITISNNTIQASLALTIQFDDASGFNLRNDAGNNFLVIGTDGTLTLSSIGDIVLDAGSGAVKVAPGDTLYVDGIAIGGEGKLIGIIPIFGFDLPAQTASTSYVQVSRVLENYPFPDAATGTNRVHKLIFRYAASSTDLIDVKVLNVDTNASTTYTLATSTTNDLDQGRAQIIDNVNIPTTNRWRVDIKTRNIPDTVRIYQIFLAAFNVKQ